MDIGINLHELRTNAGLDAKALADLVGISKSYVHKVEKNQSIPNVAIVQRWVFHTKPLGRNVSKEKLERWMQISLSFLFEDCFLDDDPVQNAPEIAEMELTLKRAWIPQWVVRILPAHFLHQWYHAKK